MQLAELTIEVRQRPWPRSPAPPASDGEPPKRSSCSPVQRLLASREELLGDLDARLTSSSADGPRVAALCGLGGTGKTSVALEYTYRNLDRLEVAWLLAAEDPAALAAGFGELAVQLGARDPQAAGDAIAPGARRSGRPAR